MSQSERCAQWMHHAQNDFQKAALVKQLSSMTDDPDVMDRLCMMAASPVGNRIRQLLIDTLGTHTERACRRFADIAHNSPEPAFREAALRNMRLLGCRQASRAVIGGLDDPDASVREAAAMNVCLYDDKDVANAFERYLERNRLALIFAFIKSGRGTPEKDRDRPDDEDVGGHRFGFRRFCAAPL